MFEIDFLEYGKRILGDVKKEELFWFCNGVIVRNIYELSREIENLNEHDFRYHVNSDNQKNDFVKWIKESLFDDILAKRLKDVMNKQEYVEIIGARIKEIESTTYPA